MDASPLLEVRELSISVLGDRGARPVVHDVSFSLARGECLALVGESGSGKTLTAFSLLGLYPSPDVVQTGGRVTFDGAAHSERSEVELRRLRGRRIGMVFQESSQALNPVRRVEAHLAEVLAAHDACPRSRRRERMLRGLVEAGLRDPEAVLRAYPFELSGGMLQRVGIALALIADPVVLIADEPTTALDPRTAGQLVDSFASLRTSRDLAILYISHDLRLVRRLADRVGVMYLGRLVELGPAARLLEAPRHPYARGLLDALTPDGRGRFRTIPGDPGERPTETVACPFAPRCARADAACRSAPPLAGDDLHRVACHHPLEAA